MRYDFITLNRACEILEISRFSLTLLIDKGELPGTQDVEMSGDKRFLTIVPRPQVAKLLDMERKKLVDKIHEIQAEAAQQRRKKQQEREGQS